MVNSQILQDLADRIVSDNAVLFLGSELFAGPGEGIVPPSKRGIARALAERFEYGKDDYSLPAVVRDYKVLHGRNALIEFLKSVLNAPQLSPTRVHQLVADLSRPFTKIITTNYDRLLEQALRRVRKGFVLIVRDSDVPYFDETKIILIKMQGCITQPDSLVITEDDYEEFLVKLPTLSDVIRALFATKTLIFIGYDLEDRGFRRLYTNVTRGVGVHQRRAYAISERDLAPVDVKFWHEKGIEVVQGNVVGFLEELMAEINRSGPVEEVEEVVPIPDQPYKFLDSFETEDAGIFFGRQEDSHRLADKILSHRLVVLYGGSGTGKTSLIRAGAAPILARRGCLPLVVRPADDPALATKRELREKLEGLPDLTTDLPSFLQAAERATEKLIVVFLDQFEEFFLRFGDESRASFIAELARCQSEAVDTRFILSIREDFFVRLHEFEGELPTIFDSRYRLERLTRENARDAIVEPAKLFDVTYEERLVERLLDDLYEEGVGPPQLQIVCDRLYREFGQAGRPIALADYEVLGGAKEILAGYLDSVLAEYAGQELEVAKGILMTLVTSQETKALASFDTIVAEVGRDREAVEATLHSLIDQRLVRGVQLSEYYELTHDYLVEEIKGWISEDARRVKEAREMLSRALADWRSSGLLIALKKLQSINAQRGRLAFGREECELLLRSAACYEYEMDYWLSRVPVVEDQVTCLADVLTPKCTPEERIHILRSLSRIKTDEVGRILQRVALEDDAAQVRQAAAVALARTGAEEAVEELAQIAWKAEGDQRARAVEALAWVWDTNAALLPDLGWSLYEKVARRVARIRLGRARGSIRSVTVGGAVGGAVGFALGLAPAMVLNLVQMEEYNVVSGLLIAPLAVVIFGVLGLVAGAGVASGISIGRALGPGRRVLAPTLGGAVGGAIGFAAGLGLYALASTRSPSTVMPPAALAGVLLAGGIAIAAGISRSPWAKLVGGVLGGTVGFSLLAVSETLPEVNLILSLVAGPIIGLAIAYGIARGEAPAARSKVKSSAGGSP
ncbi:MAG: SIR2 family protein [Anaerolineales bacterium]|nr:SIR2 family protein [Anaerolineales bacterium]